MNKSENLIFSKKIFLFILFINIIFLLVTLSHSYTDGYNLRQAQTAIIAKNIFYDNFNIFPTRISFLAPSKGNIIFEFPFVHFLTALSYKVFPISEINGRLINLLFYIFNGILFYKIQNLIFKKEISIITSSLFISSPLIFYLAHAYMPETSMMTFYLLAYYFFIKNKIKYNPLYEKLMFVVLAIAPLIKPPAGVIFLPIFLDYLEEIKLKTIFRQSIPFLISALPFLLWMYYGTFINSSFIGTDQDWNLMKVVFERNRLIDYWLDFNFYRIILTNLVIQNLNPLTFLLSIYALIRTFNSNEPLIKFHKNWIIGNLLFLFLIPGSNQGHPYYQIIFIPNLLFFTGLGIMRLKDFYSNKNLICYVLVLINFILSIAIFIYGSNEKLRISNIEEFKNVLADNIIIKKDSPSEYILYANQGMGSSSIHTYYSESYSRQFKLDSEDISDLKKQINLGAKYIFFINTSYGNTINKLRTKKEIFNWLNTTKDKLYESESILLYKLK